MARYGDIPPRWALVRNCHQAKVVRSVVTPAEVVRYALDLLVTRPPSVKKAEFEFASTWPGYCRGRQVRGRGRRHACGDPRRSPPARSADAWRYHAAIRHVAPAPATPFSMPPKSQASPGLGSDGCGEDTRAALVQFAKAQGPAGVDAAARKAAALEIKSLDEQAAK